MSSSPLASPLALLDRTIPRRIIYAVLLAIAFGIMYFASQSGQRSTSSATERHPAIESLIPANQADVLRQSNVGIDLTDGYLAQLTLNGVAIPDAELSGDRGQGQFLFQPASGRAVETLASGLNCATATFWKASVGPNQSSVVTWCFTAA